MKVRLPGVIAIVMIASFYLMGTAWSQETPTPQTPAQEAAQPASQEAAQPSTQEAVQPSTQEAAQPAGQEVAQPASQEAAQPAVTLAQVVVCQDVVDRAPVGSGDVFAKEVPKVYCFTRVVGATPGTQLTHNWYYQGTLKASVKLNVGSSDFRTWSSKTMIPEWTGEWMVEILSPEGQPLESLIFFLK